MKRIFIEPLDVLMFRSSRPFVAVESHVAKAGVISPSIFSGALKTKLLIDFCSKHGINPEEFQRKRDEDYEGFRERILKLAEANSELKSILAVIGHPIESEMPKLAIKGVFFAKKKIHQEIFPCPNDVGVNEGEIIKLQPKESLKDKIGSPIEIEIMFGKHIHVKKKEGFIDFDSFLNYLNGDIPKIIQEKPYKMERRPGIELEHTTKTTMEGKIYTAEFYRLVEDFGFVVWYEYNGNTIEPKEGLLKLGGEGKGAYYRCIEDKSIEFSGVIEKVNKDSKFKLYLATPAIFKEGWKPSIDKIKDLLGVYDLTLISALPGKPIYIGGYDFARNEEKPLRKGVNSGAIYYFKFNGEIKEDLSLPLIVSDYNPELGTGFIGRW